MSSARCSEDREGVTASRLVKLGLASGAVRFSYSHHTLLGNFETMQGPPSPEETRRMDYYEILGISKVATDLMVRKAYRQRALRLHPDRQGSADPETLEACKNAFQRLQEAFRILSNPHSRMRYDAGVLDPREVVASRQVFGRAHTPNWDDAFTSFLDDGSASEAIAGASATRKRQVPSTPFAGRSNASKRMRIPRSQGIAVLARTARRRMASKDVALSVPCTLEELYTGAVKKVSESRLGQPEPHTASFKIEPGFHDGTVLTLQSPLAGAGPVQTRTPLIIRIDELPHAYYKREIDDLVCTAKVPLVKALTGFMLSLTQLDGREIRIKTPGPVAPGMVTTIVGEGMPVRSDGQATGVGNLRVHFEVLFPTFLSEEQRQGLKVIFKSQDPFIETQNCSSVLLSTAFKISKHPSLRRFRSCPGNLKAWHVEQARAEDENDDADQAAAESA